MREITSAFFAVLTGGTLVALGVLMLLDGEHWSYYIFGPALVFLGLAAGRFMFNFMTTRGVLSTMMGDNATYDADNLDPPPVGINLYEPTELVNVFNSDKLEFKGGSIQIWGDWEGRDLKQKHLLEYISWDVDTETLYLQFKDDYRLKIKGPRKIYECDSYLKVVFAREILWSVPTMLKNQRKVYQYLFTKHGIETKSNTQWRPSRYDVGKGYQALYIQG